jgi:UDP-glucose 4-epimerase
VLHLAAQIDVRMSMQLPTFDAHINVVGSINTFLVAHRAGARRVVNTSTEGRSTAKPTSSRHRRLCNRIRCRRTA